MLGQRRSVRRVDRQIRETLGDLLLEALADPDVLEIQHHADGTLWLDSHTRGLTPSVEDLPQGRAELILTTIAGSLGLVLHRSTPILEAELPIDGSRITGLVPPIVTAPTFAIRKRAATIFTLDDYVEAGSLGISHAFTLRRALVPEHGEPLQNVLVAGGPGSGKTTLTNALLAEIAETSSRAEHLVILEDTFELQCEAPCKSVWHTTKGVSLRDLVQVAMRFRPDRIFVGEVRGAEALDLLKAWNTGTKGGVATVHANSAEDALDRLDYLAQEAGVPSQARLVAQSVDLVAFIERRGDRRLVTQLVRVSGLDPDGRYVIQLID